MSKRRTLLMLVKLAAVSVVEDISFMSLNASCQRIPMAAMVLFGP